MERKWQKRYRRQGIQSEETKYPINIQEVAEAQKTSKEKKLNETQEAKQLEKLKEGNWNENRAPLLMRAKIAAKTFGSA